MLDKILNLAKSRTVWTILVLFIVNGFEGVRDLFPGAWLPIIDALLSSLAIYFRVNPRAKL